MQKLKEIVHSLRYSFQNNQKYFIQNFLIILVLSIVLIIVPYRWALIFLPIITGAYLVIFELNFMSVRRQVSQFYDELNEMEKHREETFREIEKILKRIAKGDLTQLIPKHDSPGFDRMIPIFNQFLHHTRSITERLQSASLEIGSTTMKILSNTGQQASGSAEQASAVAEITATMEELARTAGQIADNSTEVTQQAENTEKAAEDGHKSVLEAMQGMQVMKDKMTEISHKSQTLGKHSKQIFKILNIIESISNQTHLLSLNAAIESAAAGEFGKRFSVVASEVRRLAERSREATENIRQIVDEIQRDINATILSTEEGTKEAQRAYDLAVSVKDQLTTIHNMVDRTTSSSKEISIATQQQRTASDQIVITLRDISKVSKETAKGLKETENSAKLLNALATELQLLSQNFTIKSNRNIRYIMEKMSSNPTIVSLNTNIIGPFFSEKILQYPFLELLYLSDIEGNMVAYAEGKGIKVKAEVLHVGANLKNREWFTKAMKLQSTFISPVYKSILTDRDCFTISTVVEDDNGEIVGVIGCDINANNWSKFSR